MNKKIQINTFSRRFALSVTGATSLSFGLLLPATAAEFRSMDGTGNNIADPDFGATETELLRLAENAYEDGISIPRGGDPTTLSSARAISNAISAQSASIPNSQGVSDWVWQWGQFLDHDLSLTPIPTAEPFNIEVPLDDTTFTPGGTIEFNRSAFEAGTGTDTSNPREQFNEITAYLDASSVYGSDDGRAEDLRTHDGTGQLLTTTGANGEILLPFNTFGLDNDNGPGPNPNPEDFFIAGDDRANEQVGLIAIHTLLVREHNRTAAELEARLDGGDAELIAKRDEAIADPDNGVDDEGDFIYESTRKVVGGIVQIITYEEWLPIILGEDALEEYDGYDDTVDAGISTEFSTAAFRFGHTMLSPDLLRVDNDGNLVDALSLRDSFFNPDEVFNNGIDTIFLGLASQEAQEVDTQIIDDVRNFLFTNVAPIGFDLPALNIQRGRDHGIPPINVVRAALGLGTYSDFLELTGGDADLAAAFASVYGTIDEVDLWIAGLAETEVNGGLLGETFSVILVDQFTRTRDGDRFFYLNDLEHLLALDADIQDITLSELITRNSSITNIQENAFLVESVPEPKTIVGLLGFALFVLISSRHRHD